MRSLINSVLDFQTSIQDSNFTQIPTPWTGSDCLNNTTSHFISVTLSGCLPASFWNLHGRLESNPVGINTQKIYMYQTLVQITTGKITETSGGMQNTILYLRYEQNQYFIF